MITLRIKIPPLSIAPYTMIVSCFFLLSYAVQASSSPELINFYQQIIKAEPHNASAHLNGAQLYLADGDYITGWQELEWRLGKPPECTQEIKNYIHNGGSLKNKKIVLRAEWGAGDTLMMIRYAQILHNKGAYVMVHVLHESLVPLFKMQPYIDEVWGPKDPCPPFHFQIPMMSLPMVFKTTVDTIPAQIPYIYSDHRSAYSITKRNPHEYTIGICWHGNTIHGEEKFMPLRYFAQLNTLPGVTLYSLQQHHGLDQIKQLEDPQIIHTFDETFDQVPLGYHSHNEAVGFSNYC